MSNPKIFIVDDELSVIKAIRRLLINEEYDIEYTTNPKEALDKIDNKDFDVIISDQRMPEISGLSLLINCKNKHPDAIRILMTGYEDLDVIVSAINDGNIYYYFSKPWDNQSFIQVIKDAIQYKREQDENRLILKSVFEEKEDWLTAISKMDKSQSKGTVNNEDSIKCKEIEEVANLLSRIIYVRDQELFKHGERVSQYATELAEMLDVSEEQKLNIKYAGLLHDIGKIAIKDRIVYKPASLDYNEYEEMKKHSQMGAEILHQLEYMNKIAQIVEEHHERLDGSGYPQGLRDDEILLESKIISICDTFDALTNDRVYRTSLTQQEAIDVITIDGKSQFDARFVEHFLRMIQRKEGVKS